MPQGTTRYQPGIGNRQPPNLLGSVAPGTKLFTIASNAFLNSGTISAGGTITPVSQTALTLLGNPTGGSAQATTIPLVAGQLAFNSGSLGLAGTLTPPLIEAGLAGSGTIRPSGLISTQFNRSGVGNGANTTFDTLFTYTLPASSLDVVGRGIKLRCWGYFGANGNAKGVQFQIGGVTQYNTTALTNNAGWWQFLAEFYKDGSNTQNGTCILLCPGVAVIPVDILGSATDTSTIVLTVQGASQVAGTANDVVAIGMVVEYLN